MKKKCRQGLILGNIAYLFCIASLAFLAGWKLGLVAITSLAVLDWLLWARKR